MGEVYRATDSKLGRDVALKVLPKEMATDPERLARFQREARAVAALNHPHIVTIFSVEEADGLHFLTMELVEGQSLDRHISSGGLPIEQILEIAQPLADALAAAHKKGIVHRDLKPANVMLTRDGRVKVLDFGLAKDVSAENTGDATMTSAGHTQAGMVMGTPAYMSPEQIAGRSLDHRTDIFSLGIVLHELSTGQRPFEGHSSAELASAILRDAAVPVTDLRSDLPPDLARIIRRCLEKDPRHRLQTARDVSNEFRDLARQTSSRPTPPRATSSGSSASRSQPATDSGSARADEGFRVAVLPFKFTGSNTDLAALAEGLTADIVTGLSRFPYLRVIAQNSSSRYAGQSVDVRIAGKELGARYVMEGSLRHAGAKLRLAVQIVDSISGANLWAENYERAFSPENVFELQDDIVPRIVSTVADMNGALPRSMGEVVRGKTPAQLTPYEAVLRGFAYFERITAKDLTEAREGLELALQKAPTYADAWAMLSLLCVQDSVQGFDTRADSMAAGETAARQAVEVGPSNHLAYFGLAQVIFFQKEFQSFKNAAEKAVALNPMDGNTIAFMGELLTYAGFEERGMELAERAKQLNPNHPGWYWFADFYSAYRQGDDQAALACALKVNLGTHYGAHMMIAATYGQLGDKDSAAKALRNLLKLRPDIQTVVRRNAAQWWNAKYCERLMDGLQKAGLEIPRAEPVAGSASGSTSAPRKTDSGSAPADEGFWVAVLPFKSAGANPEVAALADGISEAVIAGLSRFSYLRVISRSTTLRYANLQTDQEQVKQQLGARYVMEGNLRQSGTKLRIAVQLIDTTTGAHLWAHSYDHTFVPEEIFALQDEIVPRIVSTVADQYGILPRSMSEAVRNKEDHQLTPHEAVLSAFTYFERITSEAHARAKRTLERAVERAPDQADCWAMLSMMFRGEYVYEFNAKPDSLPKALAAARRAVEIAPTNHLAYFALAATLFFQRDRLAFRVAAKRCIELNPMDGSTSAYLGFLIAAAGDWDYGTGLVEAAVKLNPNYPHWYNIGIFMNAYHKGNYQDALDAALGINLPGSFHAHAARAAALGQLGMREEAKKSLTELLSIRPDFAARARYEYGKFYDPEFVEQIIDGLRKAGMTIPIATGS